MGLGASSREINSAQDLLPGSYVRGKLLGSHSVSPLIETSVGADDLTTEKMAIVASTVSSKMVKQMARQEGFTFVECPTGAGFLIYPPSGSLHVAQGFKYIGNAALDLVAQGFEVRALTGALQPHWSVCQSTLLGSVWLRGSNWVHVRVADQGQRWGCGNC